MTRKPFKNRKKAEFLNQLPTSTIEDCDIVRRCKFNFSFFTDDQPAAQSFADWNDGHGPSSLQGLIESLRSFSKEPLSYWKNQQSGRQNILEVYGDFPDSKKTDFVHPPSVPHDVQWARFRLAARVRLIGFVLPIEYHNKGTSCKDKNIEYLIDSNTFYVVFLDKEHKFYKTERKS